MPGCHMSLTVSLNFACHTCWVVKTLFKKLYWSFILLINCVVSSHLKESLIKAFFRHFCCGARTNPTILLLLLVWQWKEIPFVFCKISLTAQKKTCFQGYHFTTLQLQHLFLLWFKETQICKETINIQSFQCNNPSSIFLRGLKIRIVGL